MQDDDELLTPAEIAKMFKVHPRTVTRWANAGKLGSFRTLGGHRRYRLSEVLKRMEDADERADMVRDLPHP